MFLIIGTVAEWLGSALQKLLQRFESARYLSLIPFIGIFFFTPMLTKEENDFLIYWAANRQRKKRTLWQFSLGLPTGVLIVVALFVNMLTGWHKKAAMVLQTHGSMIITVLVAAVGIVVFITVFSIRHQWEQKEQRYRELLTKKEKDAANQL